MERAAGPVLVALMSMRLAAEATRRDLRIAPVVEVSQSL